MPIRRGAVGRAGEDLPEKLDDRSEDQQPVQHEQGSAPGIYEDQRLGPVERACDLEAGNRVDKVPDVGLKEADCRSDANARIAVPMNKANWAGMLFSCG